ncbi:hypothetical protein J2S00_003621 [Caldalkalibacillus uzonensis]|uniref:Transposase n=1 Tax=Caldalkalibacillus uzonensis TaxID=353224 RepID=A0ABU0CWJ6_9BACI|nr:hypothetical protein [Caldalkalibacillus uzonensis]MDQ0340781.1 hypothetical protein [Caldalkalibacillus uzonensis]
MSEMKEAWRPFGRQKIQCHVLTGLLKPFLCGAEQFFNVQQNAIEEHSHHIL